MLRLFVKVCNDPKTKLTDKLRNSNYTTMNFRQARPKVHNIKPFEGESFDSIATKSR